MKWNLCFNSSSFINSSSIKEQVIRINTNQRRVQLLESIRWVRFPNYLISIKYHKRRRLFHNKQYTTTQQTKRAQLLMKIIKRKILIVIGSFLRSLKILMIITTEIMWSYPIHSKSVERKASTNRKSMSKLSSVLNYSSFNNIMRKDDDRRRL